MVANAHITSTIAAVQSYKAAVTTFSDSHGGELPGDYPVSGATIADTNTEALEDGYVGAADWGATYAYGPNVQVEAAHQMGIMCPPNCSPRMTTLSEPTNFWLELAHVGLISGISGTGTGFGLSNPSASTGGGFVVGYADGTPPKGFPGGAEGPVGHVLMLIQDLTDGNDIKTLPLLVKRAAQFDRRMDDGMPTTGSVVAYGEESCFNGGSDPSVPAYNEEATKTRDCGLFFTLN
jgi:hypothetical protein